MTLTGRLRTVAAGLVGAGCVLLAAGCGNGSSGLASVGSTATATSQSTAQSGSTSQSTGSSAGPSRPSSTAAAASAAGKPLKLAHFPATKDGDLARQVCQTWSSLRGEYYLRVKTDSPSQLSQWFTGSDWTTVHAGTLQLGADPEYLHLSAAIAHAMAGSVASAKTGRAVDRACSAGN